MTDPADHVHVTVLPTGTVVDDGSNRLFFTAICVDVLPPVLVGPDP
jgi:hypothetical protein